MKEGERGAILRVEVVESFQNYEPLKYTKESYRRNLGTRNIKGQKMGWENRKTEGRKG